MKRLIPTILTVLSFCALAIGGTPTTLPAPVASQLQADIRRDLIAAKVAADVQVQVAGYQPFMVWADPSAHTTSIVSTQPTVTDLKLAGPVDISGKANAQATAVAPDQILRLIGGSNGSSVVVSDAATTNCTLENVILDSVDGKGVGWNVRGTGLTIKDVQLKNLGDALRIVDATNLTLINPKQIGNVTGRCVFITNWNGGTWTGGELGPSQSQSPLRASSTVGIPNGGGLQNVTIDGVKLTQVGSQFQIACLAGHRMINCKINNLTADSGEVSFDNAGEGLLDAVKNCELNNCTINNSKLRITDIVDGFKVNGGSFSNPTGECISISGGKGVVIDGASIYSSSGHGVHFYQPGDCVIKNCTFYRTNPSAVLMDGTCVAANDGGGNKIVDVKK